MGLAAIIYVLFGLVALLFTSIYARKRGQDLEWIVLGFSLAGPFSIVIGILIWPILVCLEVLGVKGATLARENQDRDRIKKTERDRLRKIEERELLHKSGRSVSDLRPYGEIRVGDIFITVKSRTGFISAGSPVTIVDFTEGTALVEPTSDR